MSLQRFMNGVRASQAEARAMRGIGLSDIHWLEQTEADAPTDNQWLSAGEKTCLSGMRFAKRRADWRLGRWTAKHAVASCLNLSTDLDALANIEIRAASSGAPEVFLDHQPAQVAISLSHRAGIALCALGSHEACVGCDVEKVEAHGAAFIADYFTEGEKTLIEQATAEERLQLVTLLWSGKESVLKALHVGLRFDTKSVRVTPADAGLHLPPPQWRDPVLRPWRSTNPDGWRPLRACYGGTQVFGGWWRFQDDLVRTIVSVLPLRTPVRLRPADPMVTIEPVPPCS